MDSGIRPDRSRTFDWFPVLQDACDGAPRTVARVLSRPRWSAQRPRRRRERQLLASLKGAPIRGTGRTNMRRFLALPISLLLAKIGRASCRERWVVWVVGVSGRVCKG